jgi:hypothetical protein
MGMIRAIRFTRRDADEGEVKRMAPGQIEGIRLTTKGNRDFLDGFGILSTRRLALLCGNISEVHFFHGLDLMAVGAG